MSLLVGLSAAIMTVLIGVTVGALAGYFLGWVEEVLMRITEFFQVLPEDISRITKGRILFDGQDITHAYYAALRALRGNDISMIFQEPMTSLNPVFTIGEQIAEVLRQHKQIDKPSAWKRAVELLDAVRIPEAARRASSHPHQLPGGQRQRVMIAMALACEPRILIADEPTTALDVTIQAQIFDSLEDLRAQTGTAIILITHDLGVVQHMCDRIALMYMGQIVEYADRLSLFNNPCIHTHPPCYRQYHRSTRNDVKVSREF